MSSLKVIKLVAESSKSWEDAAKNAVAEAAKTGRNIHTLYAKKLTAKVVDGKIALWQFNCKITFDKE